MIAPLRPGRAALSLGVASEDQQVLPRQTVMAVHESDAARLELAPSNVPGAAARVTAGALTLAGTASLTGEAAGSAPRHESATSRASAGIRIVIATRAIARTAMRFDLTMGSCGSLCHRWCSLP